MNTFIQKYFQGDRVIWLIFSFLCMFSIVIVYSASGTMSFRKTGDTEYFLFKHIITTVICFLSAWVTHRIDHRMYLKLSHFTLLISIALLIITWQSGTIINNASRWLTIPFINQKFQPSDIAKLALFVKVSLILAKHQEDEESIKKTFIPLLFWICIICGIIALANFSTAILIFFTCMVIMFFGRIPHRYLGRLFLFGIVVASISLIWGERGETVKKRITAFIPIITNSDSIPYQATNSYIAIANGGYFGEGLVNSTQKNTLPHSPSDFIYAIIIEELGLLGGVVIIFAYLALFYRGMIIFIKSESTYGGFLSAALSFCIVLQAMIHIGVTVGLGPITGLPLPLISMGGTSQIFMGVGVGMILSVSRSNETTTQSIEEEKLS
ncbi:MAG: FtsW/RodA/SpoVE family cell cycle protein [Chitinophagaceae bacterium]|nr:FtsW/RodA/SpoVE family cell cycle protein [Chitinophagaceae bacterium]